MKWRTLLVLGWHETLERIAWRAYRILDWCERMREGGP
jgi:hypothetical protein